MLCRLPDNQKEMLEPASSEMKTRILKYSAGWILIVLAGLIFWGSVLNIDLERTSFYDLGPEPDAAEYLDGAVALFREGSHHIHIGGTDYPSRYPPGYSLLLTPFLALGTPIVKVPFVANRFFAGALLLLVLLAGWRLWGFLAGALSAFLLSTQPGFINLSRSPMSEIAGVLFLIAGFFCLAHTLRTRQLLWGATGALLLGLSCCIRTAHLLLAGGLLIVLVLAAPLPDRRLRYGLWLGGFFLAGLLPALVHNQIWFGSPVANGYDFWLSDPGLFQWGNLPQKLGFLWDELALRTTPFSTANLYGDGRYLGPAGFLLVVLLAVSQRSRRPFQIFLLPCLAYLSVLLFYGPFNGRLLFPVTVLATLFAGIASAGILESKAAGNRAWQGLVLVLLLAVGIDFPNREGESGLLVQLRHSKLTGRASGYRTWQLLDQYSSPHATVFSDLTPAYVDALSSSPVNVHPLRDHHSYSFNPRNFRLEPEARRRLVADALKEKNEVFLLTRRVSLATAERYVGLPETHRWKLEQETDGGAGLARALPRSDPSPAQSLPVEVDAGAGTPADSAQFLLPVLANGTQGHLRYQTRLFLFSTGNEDRVLVEAHDRQGLPWEFPWETARDAGRFWIPLQEREFVRLEGSGQGELQTGTSSLWKSPETQVYGVLTVIDQESENTLTEARIPVVSSSAGAGGVSLESILRGRIRDLTSATTMTDSSNLVSGNFLIPVFSNGSDGRYRYQTELIFSNQGKDSVLDLQFIGSDGSPVEMALPGRPPASQFSREIAEGEELRLGTPGRGNLQWGHIHGETSGSLQLTALQRCRATDSGKVLWEVLIPVVKEPGRHFVLPSDSTGLRETHLFLVNPVSASSSNRRAAGISLHFYDASGESLEEQQIQLKAGELFQSSIQALFSSSEERQGTVRIDSNTPVGIVAYGYLEGYNPETGKILPRLYALPVVELD